MLKIKLSKVGKANQKVFRIIISEASRDPYGRHLEILGAYNPYSKEFKVKAERVKYWLSKGAKMTPTVNNLLLDNKVIDGEKVKASKKGKINKKKKEEETKKEEVKEEKKGEVKEEKKEEVKEDIDKKA